MSPCAKCGEPAPERRSYCDACEAFFSRPAPESDDADRLLAQLALERRILRQKLMGARDDFARDRLRAALTKNKRRREELEESIARARGYYVSEPPARPLEDEAS